MSDLREPAHRVSPRAPRYWLVTGLAGTALLVGAVVVGTAFWSPDGWRWWIVGGVAALGLAGDAVTPVWRYRTHRWEVSERAIYTQQGAFSRERRIAPMSRVQTVEMSQGAVERLFGLATVTVTTASAAGALQIEGLDQAVAAPLVEELTRRAEDLTGDAT